MRKAQGEESLFMEILLDKVPLMAAIVDLEERYLCVNQQYADFHHHEKDYFKGRQLQEILPESTYHRVLFPIEQVKKGESTTFENTIRSHEGVVETFKVTYEPVFNEKGKVIAFTALMSNITLQKATENELIQSVEFVEKLLEVAPIGITLLDSHGTITYENPAMRKMMGVPDHVESPVIGKRIDEIKPVIESGAHSFFKSLLKGDAVKNTQVDFTSLYGRRAILDVFASAVHDRYNRLNGGILLAVDVSHRLEMEEKLRASEERFKKAFMLNPDAININRMEDGMFVDVNEGFTRITGYSRRDVVGKTSLELNIWTHPEDRGRMIAKLRRYGRIHNFKAPFRTKSGEIIQGLLSAAMVDIDGTPHILSITRQID